MFHVEAFALSNSYFFRPLLKFPKENNLRKLLVNAELLEFVIKRRSANHSWRPSSKAAPKFEMKISSSQFLSGFACDSVTLRGNTEFEKTLINADQYIFLSKTFIRTSLPIFRHHIASQTEKEHYETSRN